MRVQILPLPPVETAFTTETPFALVLDQLNPEQLRQLQQMPALVENLRIEFGARTVLIGDQSGIEVSPHMDLPPELQKQLIAHLNTITKDN